MLCCEVHLLSAARPTEHLCMAGTLGLLRSALLGAGPEPGVVPSTQGWAPGQGAASSVCSLHALCDGNTSRKESRGWGSSGAPHIRGTAHGRLFSHSGCCCRAVTQPLSLESDCSHEDAGGSQEIQNFHRTGDQHTPRPGSKKGRKLGEAWAS